VDNQLTKLIKLYASSFTAVGGKKNTKSTHFQDQ